MMIRINLLPVRQVLKKQQGQREVLLYATALALVALLNFVWLHGLQSEQRQRTATNQEIQAKIEEVRQNIKNVKDINRRKKEIDDRLAVLSLLDKGRMGPVRMLDALATVLPENVDLIEFIEENKRVRLTGKAEGQDDVAELMGALSKVVWTPRGIGREIEKKPKEGSIRVELYASQGANFDFKETEVAYFFDAVLLKGSDNARISQQNDNSKRSIAFEITFTANYSI